MLNRVQLIGFVAQDPRLHRAPHRARTTLRLVTFSPYCPAPQSTGRASEWHQIVLHGKLALRAANTLRQGQLLYVEGHLRHTSWSHQGAVQYWTEIEAENYFRLGPWPVTEDGSPVSDPDEGSASGTAAVCLSPRGAAQTSPAPRVCTSTPWTIVEESIGEFDDEFLEGFDVAALLKQIPELPPGAPGALFGAGR